MKRHLTMGFGLSLAIFGTPPALASHAWSTYHWASTAQPFTLEVIDSTTADWDVQLGNTVDEWSLAEPFDLGITASDDSKSIRKRCPMASGMLRVCNAAYGYNGWLGLATIGIDRNGHIDQGTAQVNDSYSTYWTSQSEKNHVICQETGHLLGLDHTSEDGTSQGTCMDYSTDAASQWPNDHDYDELALIYDHLDAYDSFATSDSGAGSSGGGNGCNAPPGRGCNKLGSERPFGVLVHKGRHEEIWVASRRDGGLWIRLVRLAP